MLIGCPTVSLCFRRLCSLGGLCRAQSLDARIEAALVTGYGVGVQNALLHALVERGDGGAVLLLCSLGITLGQSVAQRTQAGAHAAAVGAVHFGTGYGLTG